MVSLQEERETVSPNLEAFSSSMKRKRQDQGDQDHQESKRSREPKPWQREQARHLDHLHLDAPLPLEWQRCLDIKSGQIHFYNTLTHKRTCRDPRSSPDPPPPPSSCPSLDLELNLNVACNNSSSTKLDHDREQAQTKLGPPCDPSWITIDVDRQVEMVAAVCMRCHMLVMMCKASPSCPNCKFLHPQGQSSPPLLNNKLGFRLLCCKD